VHSARLIHADFLDVLSAEPQEERLLILLRRKDRLERSVRQVPKPRAKARGQLQYGEDMQPGQRDKREPVRDQRELDIGLGSSLAYRREDLSQQFAALELTKGVHEVLQPYRELSNKLFEGELLAEEMSELRCALGWTLAEAQVQCVAQPAEVFVLILELAHSRGTLPEVKPAIVFSRDRSCELVDRDDQEVLLPQLSWVEDPIGLFWGGFEETVFKEELSRRALRQEEVLNVIGSELIFGFGIEAKVEQHKLRGELLADSLGELLEERLLPEFREDRLFYRRPVKGTPDRTGDEGVRVVDAR